MVHWKVLTHKKFFSFWSNLQNNGGRVNYSIETENLIPGVQKHKVKLFH